MAFDFPSSPTVGQQFTPVGGVTYTWNGYGWDGGSGILIVSDTPPASPTNGSLWWESDTGTLWIYYTDANTSQWVAIGGGSAAAPGSWVLIQQTPVTVGLANVDFTTGLDLYDEYEMVVSNVMANANIVMGLRFSHDGGASFIATNSYSIGGYVTSASGVGAGAAYIASTDSINLLYNGQGTQAGCPFSSRIFFFSPKDTTGRKRVVFQSSGWNPTNGAQSYNGFGEYWAANSAVNGLRFLPVTSTFVAGGYVALYGRRK